MQFSLPHDVKNNHKWNEIKLKTETVEHTKSENSQKVREVSPTDGCWQWLERFMEKTRFRLMWKSEWVVVGESGSDEGDDS